MPAENGENEIIALTGLRGLLSSYVAIFHFAPMLYSLLPESLPLEPLISSRRLAVPLFFILSGYALSLRYRHKLEGLAFSAILRFWWLRLGRLYPIHIVTLLASLAMVGWRGWPSDPGHSPASFIFNLLLIHAWMPEFTLSWNYPAWTISSEAFAYLVFPLIAIALSRLSKQWCMAMLAIACALAMAVYSAEEPMPFRGLLVVLPTFTGGAILAVVVPPFTLHGWRKRIADALIVVFVIIPFAIEYSPVRNAMFILLFFAIVATLAGAGNGASAFWKWRPFVYLGEISYSLYMTHAITMTLEASFLPLDVLAETSLPVRIAVVVGLLLLIFVGAMLSYYLIERPMRNLSRRMIARAPDEKSPVGTSLDNRSKTKAIPMSTYPA